MREFNHMITWTFSLRNLIVQTLRSYAFLPKDQNHIWKRFETKSWASFYELAFTARDITDIVFNLEIYQDIRFLFDKNQLILAVKRQLNALTTVKSPFPSPQTSFGMLSKKFKVQKMKTELSPKAMHKNRTKAWNNTQLGSGVGTQPGTIGNSLIY